MMLDVNSKEIDLKKIEKKAYHYLLNVSPSLYFIPLGVAILISGAVVLIRFLRKYPKIAEEVFDGNH